jgi:type I restriction enzyme S subunit
MSSKPKTDATKEDGKPALVPTLRFPEFRDAEGWKPKRLGLALKFQAGFPFPSSGFNDARKGLRLIRNRDLRSDDIVIFYSESYDPNFVVNNGDVLVGMDGDFTPTVWGKGEALLNQRVGRILPREDNDHRFLLYLLTLSLKGIEEATARTTVKHLSHSAVEDKHEPVPKPPEQQKIAECLSSVDELIVAQARKLDALKAHKKGLMQQLFPREGETQPRLRFPEFQNAGEWVEISLGEYFDPIRNGFVGTATPYYTTSEGVRYLQGRNIKEGKIESNNFIYITEAFHQRQRKSHLKLGDILMVQSGHVGECASVSSDFIGCNCHALVILTPKRKLSSEFFVHYFYSPIGKLAIFQITTGNTIKHILASELKELPVFTPSLAEQQRIADCLTSLDDLIAAQTQKIDALKIHKKGLMQQLFPSPEEVEA